MQDLKCRHPDGTQRMPTTPPALPQPPVTPAATEITAEPGVPETPVSETEAAATKATSEPGVPEAPEPRMEASQDETETIKAGVLPLVARQPQTRSQTCEQHPIGTIVRQWFSDNNWHEGEVTGFDATNNLYKVKYQDGDVEEYEPKEMRKYLKKTSTVPKNERGSV